MIADAILSTSTAMVEQLKNIADARLEVERSKMDVQMKLFTEQMQYRRDRDQRMLENARLANENRKLAIQVQDQVISCLTQLSHVLQAGLNVQFVVPAHRVKREEPSPIGPSFQSPPTSGRPLAAHEPPSSAQGPHADEGTPGKRRRLVPLDKVEER